MVAMKSRIYLLALLYYVAMSIAWAQSGSGSDADTTLSAGDEDSDDAVSSSSGSTLDTANLDKIEENPNIISPEGDDTGEWSGWELLTTTGELSAFKKGAMFAFSAMGDDYKMYNLVPGDKEASSSETKSMYVQLIGKGPNGDILMKGGDDEFFAYDGAIDPEKPVIGAYATEESATMFRVYKFKDEDIALLISQGDAISLIDGEWKGSPAITYRSYLFPVGTDGEEARSKIHELDARMLGYRKSTLENGGKLASRWIAYDLAMALLFDENFSFNKFQSSNGTTDSMKLALRTTFQLISRRLNETYQDKFGSLGEDICEKFQIRELARENVVSNGDYLNWTVVMDSFIKNGYEPKSTTDAFARCIVTQQKMIDYENDESLVVSDNDNEFDLMAKHLYASAFLANAREDWTFAEKVNHTRVLYNRLNSENLTQLRDETVPGEFWFTPIVENKVNESIGIHSIVQMAILANAGITEDFSADFLSKDGNVGEGVANPILSKLQDAIMASSNGVSSSNLKKIHEMGSNNGTKELMDFVSTLCAGKGFKINLCLLPHIFQQVNNFATKQSASVNPDIPTDLQEWTESDVNEYLDTLATKSDYLSIHSELFKSVGEFGELAFKFKDQLMDVVKTDVTKEMKAYQDNIKTTASTLRKFMKEKNGFKKEVARAKMDNILDKVEDAEKDYKDGRDGFMELVDSIKLKADLNQIFEGVMNIVNIALDFKSAKSGVKSQEETGLGPIGDVINGVKNTIQNGIRVIDNQKAKTYASALEDQLNYLVDGMKTDTDTAMNMGKVMRPLIDAINDKDMSDEAFANITSNYSEAVANYRTATNATAIAGVQQAIEQLASGLCEETGRASNLDCMKFPQKSSLMFSALTNIDTFLEEYRDTVRECAKYAVTERTDNMLNKDLEDGALSDDEINSIIKDDDVKSKTDLLRWYKLQNYHALQVTSGLLANQVKIISALRAKCDQSMYMNGGETTRECKTYIYDAEKEITKDNIDFIRSTPDSDGFEDVYKRTATIPTGLSEASGNSSFFINFNQLMRGQTVHFSFPTNEAEWLATNKWIDKASDLENKVHYITKFQVTLPPRYANYAEEGDTVQILVKSGNVTNLGPARNNKMFNIPERLFWTEYEQRPGDEKCDDHKYQECAYDIPNYCIERNGENGYVAQEAIQPSLFSDWSMTAVFGESNGDRINFDTITTPALIYVDYDVMVYSVNRRRLQSEDSGADEEAVSGNDSAGSAQTTPSAEVKENSAEPTTKAPSLRGEESEGSGTSASSEKFEDNQSARSSKAASSLRSEESGAATTSTSAPSDKDEDGEAMTSTASASSDEDDDDDSEGSTTTASSSEDEDDDSTRSSTKATSGAGKRCCKINQYLFFSKEGNLECFDCPENSFSQFGGLYCATQYGAGGTSSDTSNTTKTMTTEDDDGSE